jgi:hypothetical protein
VTAAIALAAAHLPDGRQLGLVVVLMLGGGLVGGRFGPGAWRRIRAHHRAMGSYSRRDRRIARRAVRKTTRRRWS